MNYEYRELTYEEKMSAFYSYLADLSSDEFVTILGLSLAFLSIQLVLDKSLIMFKK